MYVYPFTRAGGHYESRARAQGGIMQLLLGFVLAESERNACDSYHLGLATAAFAGPLADREQYNVKVPAGMTRVYGGGYGGYGPHGEA